VYTVMWKYRKNISDGIEFLYTDGILVSAVG